MKISKITQIPSLIQLTVYPYIFPINCYLWEVNNELILIDTNKKGAGEKISQYIRTLSKPLKSIILTHAHSDHIGGLSDIKQNFPEAQIFLHQHEFPTYEKYLNDNKLDDLSLQNVEFVREGDNIGGLSILETPGHTPGSISLYNSQEELLFCGDLLQVQGGFAVCGDKRILFPFPTYGTADFHQSLISANDIKDLAVSFLCAGHGAIITDYNQRIESVINRGEVYAQKHNR